LVEDCAIAESAPASKLNTAQSSAASWIVLANLIFILSRTGGILFGEAYPSEGAGCEKKQVQFVPPDAQNGCIAEADLLRQWR
jgi:hypothetical protein